SMPHDIDAGSHSTSVAVPMGSVRFVEPSGATTTRAAPPPIAPRTANASSSSGRSSGRRDTGSASNQSIVGIDMGIASFVITSDGTHLLNPRHGKNTADALADTQRELTKFPRR